MSRNSSLRNAGTMNNHSSPYRTRLAVLLAFGAGTMSCISTMSCSRPNDSATSSSTATTAPGPALTATANAVGSSAFAKSDDHAAELKQSRLLVQRFAKALKKELMAGMSKGGPVNAIAACSEKAPGIAKTLDLDPGWDIRRTSLRLRNPDNAPDAWERATLERFQGEKASGAAVGELEAYEVVSTTSGKEFRYLKAIGTGGLCLNCHGTTISAEVASALDNRYPKDQARGLAAGDLRGAFSIRKKIAVK